MGYFSIGPRVIENTNTMLTHHIRILFQQCQFMLLAAQQHVSEQKCQQGPQHTGAHTEGTDNQTGNSMYAMCQITNEGGLLWPATLIMSISRYKIHPCHNTSKSISKKWSNRVSEYRTYVIDLKSKLYSIHSKIYSPTTFKLEYVIKYAVYST